MCSSAAHYIDLEDEDSDQSDKKFYNKTSDKWDYYSGLPNPKAYETE